MMTRIDRGGFAEVEQARDFLVHNRLNYLTAYTDFVWPNLEKFNFVDDWFDVIGAVRDREALRIASDGQSLSWNYSELSVDSRRVANFLVDAGLERGEAVLVMLGSHVALWTTMLACMRIGAVIIPASTSLTGADLEDRMKRGGVRFVVTHSSLVRRFDGQSGCWTGIAVGSEVAGWLDYNDTAKANPDFTPRERGRRHDPMLLYFTSGTTAKPKLVVHDQVSYPIGHLSTLYWLGLKTADVHLNISSPGWAKHAWSSFFAPWLGEGTVLALDHERFDPLKTLDVIERQGVTTFCAPPTVWRMLVQQDLSRWGHTLREAVSAGEPLNSEVVELVRNAWGVTVRDGFGQTETTAQIGNTPGMRVKPGSVGKPLPGFKVRLLPSSEEGEICIELGDQRPVGMMSGYLRDGQVVQPSTPFHHTGDVASEDEDGYIFFVGRSDDVFKSSDYRISPFELESVLVEHPAVMEAAIVPSPDPIRLAVPKAFICLAQGTEADASVAKSIFAHCKKRLPRYKQITRIEFLELPKTISGKIKRVELRLLEADRRLRQEKGVLEWLAGDFPQISSLRSGEVCIAQGKDPESALPAVAPE